MEWGVGKVRHMLNLIGKCTLSGKVGYSLWLNELQAKPFCLFLEGEFFLKAKVNAVIERTLIHSHVKWPCEECPEGEKALNEFERVAEKAIVYVREGLREKNEKRAEERERRRERETDRERGGRRQIESSNITDPQISFWVLVELELSGECLLKAPFLLPFHCCRAFRARWWQIVSYLISFIILPSGGVCSALSKSWRTNKQPAWFDGLQGDICSAVQNENNTLR